MINDNNGEGKVLSFTPKAFKDKKQKPVGVIQLTEDNKVSITMGDQIFLLEGTSAFDFGLLLLCAAKVILSGETINIKET